MKLCISVSSLYTKQDRLVVIVYQQRTSLTFFLAREISTGVQKQRIMV